MTDLELAHESTKIWLSFKRGLCTKTQFADNMIKLMENIEKSEEGERKLS